MDIKRDQRIFNEAQKIAKEGRKRSDEIGDFLRRMLTGPISDREYRSRMKLFAESFKREAAAIGNLFKNAKKLAEEGG